MKRLTPRSSSPRSSSSSSGSSSPGPESVEPDGAEVESTGRRSSRRRSPRSSRSEEPRAGSRAARKLQTRQALLDAAMRLMEHHSLSSISLREVARAAGIVPAGFYRHFPDMDSLGVALVEESFEPLHDALRTVRTGFADSDEVIHRSLLMLAQTAYEHRDLFRFIARERYGGALRVREAIRDQLRRFTDELADDLRSGAVGTHARLDEWPPGDVEMLAQLVVNHMVQTTAALMDAPDQAALVDAATVQLRLVMLGARHWLDAPDD